MANVQVTGGKGFSNSSALLLAGLHIIALKDVAMLGHLAIKLPMEHQWTSSTVPGLHTANSVWKGSTFSQSISVPSSISDEWPENPPGERLRELGLAATILCQELRCQSLAERQRCTTCICGMNLDETLRTHFETHFDGTSWLTGYWGWSICFTTESMNLW